MLDIRSSAMRVIGVRRYSIKSRFLAALNAKQHHETNFE